MEYLKQFNLTDEDIDDICNTIDDMDINELIMHESRVMAIINYFNSIGLHDLKSILIVRPNLFYEDVEYIKSGFEKYGVEQAVSLINENIMNFDVINL